MRRWDNSMIILVNVDKSTNNWLVWKTDRWRNLGCPLMLGNLLGHDIVHSRGCPVNYQRL